MNEDEARRRLAQYVPSLQGDVGFPPPPTWLGDTPSLYQLPNGDWLATSQVRPRNGILLKSNGTNVPFYGALGEMFPLLNWLPASREYFLGSALQGRYQLYSQGLAVWEAFEGIGDIGKPVARWDSIEDQARRCLALIAFFDLRGFTNWSSGQRPKLVQDTVERFEIAFQNAFFRPWCQQVFAKGTGDGLMVVSEAGRCAGAPGAGDDGWQPGHVKLFSLACARTVEDAAKDIPEDLAVACGITLGEVTQLYLLGRPDYIGPAVNDASKIQAGAYGEVCLSTNVVDRLRMEGVEIVGVRMPGKGLRLPVTEFVRQLA
jgi:class 3 adenylate cyclase